MTNKCCPPKRTWYQNPLMIISVIGIASIFITANLTIHHNLLSYFYSLLSMVWSAILLGFIAGGLIDYYVPKIYIEKLLALPKKRTLITAGLLGILLSTCSHGILAIGMQLYKKGASIPSIIVLLTATPWANLPITILLFRFFGWNALIIMGCAFIIALLTGLIFQYLDSKHKLDKCPAFDFKKTEDFSITQDIKRRYHNYTWNLQQTRTDLAGILKGSISLANMIIWWFIIALIMSTYLGYFVPSTIFQTYFSASFLGLLSTLAITTVIEVCSEGSSILAFELYRQTGALGNVFVFLLAGVATDYTEIGLIWATIGKRTAIWLPVISVPLIVIAGILINMWG